MPMTVESMRHEDSPGIEIDLFDRPDETLHSSKQLAQRIDDRVLLKFSSGNLWKHWRKQEIILSCDQRHLETIPPCQYFFKSERGVDATETTTKDQHTFAVSCSDGFAGLANTPCPRLIGSHSIISPADHA